MPGDVAGPLSAHVSPLSGTTPDADRDDLRTLDLGSADVVGLGEATHGTRELIELKHRLVRHLVADCGFRTVALETGMANTLAIDDAIRDPAADLRAALDGLELWIWRTASFLSLLQWLRSFNEGRRPDDRVRVRGLSVGDPAAPATALQQSLDAVAPAVADDCQSALRTFAGSEIPDDPEPRERHLDRGEALAARVRDRLDGGAATDDGTNSEVATVRRLCRQLEQSCAWNRTRLATPSRFDPDAFEQRDRYMADNAAWASAQDAGAGVVVWAHNAHVKRGRFDLPFEWATGRTMGEFLARDHGVRYRVVGTDFVEGRFRAVDSRDGTDRTVRTFATDPPPARSLTATLATLSDAPFFLDVASAGDDPALDGWLDRSQWLRSVAAVFDPDAAPPQGFMQTAPGCFDGFCVLGETSQTVGLDP